jgi:hypothetical protein
MAGSMILGWIPLPVESAAYGIRGLPEALVVSLRAYWVIVLLNLAHQAWPVWREIRRGGESPTNPFVSLGRVLVVCTVMVVLHVIHVNAIAVAVLLFLFYIPDDIFAKRVLGMQ